MTCSSCELLLERKIKAVPGVIDVHVHHRKGMAVITAHSDALPSSEKIEHVVRKAGYRLAEDGEPTVSSVDPDTRKWMEIGGSLLIIFAIYKLLQAFDLVSLAPSTSGASPSAASSPSVSLQALQAASPSQEGSCSRSRQSTMRSIRRKRRGRSSSHCSTSMSVVSPHTSSLAASSDCLGNRSRSPRKCPVI